MLMVNENDDKRTSFEKGSWNQSIRFTELYGLDDKSFGAYPLREKSIPKRTQDPEAFPFLASKFVE